MKKILNWINKDGALHILCCLAIVTSLAHLLHPALAFFLGVFVGFAKEILWDAWMRKGQFSWHDIVCDLVGSVIGIVIVLIGMAIC